MKAPSGYILIKGERFDETFQTPGGMTLYRYLQEGNETKDVNFWGEVVAIPDDAGKDIVPEVLVGDKAYFHYNSFLTETNQVLTEDGVFWKIPYAEVICVVRHTIIPIGGWCLVEPELKKLTSESVILDDFIIKSETKGTIAYIGTPKKNWEEMNPPLVPGDIVAFSEHDAFENRIEGVSYYCMMANRILGIYGKG